MRHGVLFFVLPCCLASCYQSNEVATAFQSEPLVGTVVAALPRIPKEVLVQEGLETAYLEFSVTCAECEPIQYEWPLADLPEEDVVIDEIPAGNARVFQAAIIDENGIMTHHGESRADIFPNNTAYVTIRLLKMNGTASVCIELEGLTPCGGSPDTDSEEIKEKGPSADTAEGEEHASPPFRGVVAEGLVAYFPLNGDARDHSGQNNHGTIFGATPVPDRHNRQGKALGFDGDDYIEVPHAQSLDCEEKVSIAVWAKSDIHGLSYTSDGIIIQKGFAAEACYGITWHSFTQSMVTRFRQYYDPLTIVEVCGKENVCVNRNAIAGGVVQKYGQLDTDWNFWTMTFDGRTLIMYHNGLPVESVSAKPGEITDYPLRIGAQSKSLQRFWVGAIDEVRIYNRALSAEEIEILFWME